MDEASFVSALTVPRCAAGHLESVETFPREPPVRTSTTLLFHFQVLLFLAAVALLVHSFWVH